MSCLPRWLWKKIHIQGVEVCQGRNQPFLVIERLTNRNNAVDGTFYDAINKSIDQLSPKPVC
jgi:hypothetical protein